MDWDDLRDALRFALAATLLLSLALAFAYVAIIGLDRAIDSTYSDYHWVCTDKEKPVAVYMDDRVYCAGAGDLGLPTRELRSEKGGTY